MKKNMIEWIMSIYKDCKQKNLLSKFINNLHHILLIFVNMKELVNFM